jgi:hypothetical protein
MSPKAVLPFPSRSPLCALERASGATLEAMMFSCGLTQDTLASAPPNSEETVFTGLCWPRTLFEDQYETNSSQIETDACFNLKPEARKRVLSSVGHRTA